MAIKPKYRKPRKLLIVLLILLISFVVYVEIVNRNSKEMTYRQKVLKAVYPAWMWWSKLRGKNITRLSNENTPPPVSFYSLSATLNNGELLNFETLKGKKVLLVNTASDCGYTNQYEDLQKLYEQEKERLVILGFPANDFKEQEKGNDEEIAQFCRLNYGVTFPLVKKSSVIKGENQNPVFKWLTDSSQNGWNSKPPSWNFCKYIVNEAGILTSYFGASVSPVSDEVIKALKQ